MGGKSGNIGFREETSAAAANFRSSRLEEEKAEPTSAQKKTHWMGGARLVTRERNVADGYNMGLKFNPKG